MSASLRAAASRLAADPRAHRAAAAGTTSRWPGRSQRAPRKEWRRGQMQKRRAKKEMQLLRLQLQGLQGAVPTQEAEQRLERVQETRRLLRNKTMRQLKVHLCPP